MAYDGPTLVDASPKTFLFVGLAAIGAAFVAGWARALVRERSLRTAVSAGGSGSPGDAPEPISPSATHLAIGFVTNFFDTLGIGSYAPTTSLFRLRSLVPDRLIPGTLNVGHTLPSFAEAFIFIAIVEVDMTTLVAMLAASAAGSWVGAGIVTRWPERKIQVGMSVALFAAATLMVLSLAGVAPAGGTALGLSGGALVVAVAGNFVFGALMNLGIGLFAPCMILLYLLGVHPKAAFPIMMGSCAVLMPVASARFIENGRYSPRAALGLTLGGLPAVLIAAFLVKSLPLRAVRWLVVFVVVYTAVGLYRASRRGRRGEAART
jgi:uncharacterized membrane protein YfcA